MGIFANSLSGVLFGIGFLIALVLFFVVTFGDLDGIVKTILAGIIVIIGGLFWYMASFGFNYRIVPINTVGLVVNKNNSALVSNPGGEGYLRGPGITRRGFFAVLHLYPATTRQQACMDFVPAAKGGYAIVTKMCFNYNASKVDWVRQFQQYNITSADGLYNVWQRQLSSKIYQTAKDFTPKQFAEEYDVVNGALVEGVRPWFNEQGIEVQDMYLADWDFEDPNVGAQFDSTILQNIRVTEEEAKFQAAIKARERALYEADTAILEAEKLREAFDELGIPKSDVVNWLWLNLFDQTGKVPDVVILGNGANVAVPLPDQPQELPAPVQ